MNTTTERLRRFEPSVPSRWRENAEARLANQEERRQARKLAMNILNALDHIGLSGEAFADKLGIAYDELCPILKGHRLPTKKMEGEILMILGIG